MKSRDVKPKASGKAVAGAFKVKVYPDSALKTPAEDIECFDENLVKFVEKLHETMSAHDGVGLAATQVGVLKKIALVEFENELYVLINPRLLSQEGVQEGDEGCLSFPGIYAPVKRPLRISVSTLDISGAEMIYDVEGFLARAFLHEMDHLEGRLFIEHLSGLKRGMIRKKMYKRAVGDEY
ncbi:MAG: peptide deformylase [Synergistaceae bacterium]|nr:peptide deformylase [Synergistaceae bacterium]